jgi:hypothetical protein
MFTKPNLTNAAIAGFQVGPGIAVFFLGYYYSKNILTFPVLSILIKIR